MKSLKTFALALLLALPLGFHSDTARADQELSFDFFYDHLQPYGEWVQLGDYGYCWHPNGVAENWQPYADGYWAYTDDGWTWVSYEDYGWITYHYGRWVNAESVGWCWVPDYQWAPAWVSWRSNDTCVGWAPLPPDCAFDPGIGVSVWVDHAYDIGPGYYNFVYVRDFGSPGLLPLIIDRGRNITIINQTTNITNITYNNGSVYTGGPSYKTLAAHSSRPIPTFKLVRQTDPAAFGSGGLRAQGNQLIAPGPRMAKPTTPFKPANVARVIASPVVNKGWSGIDPKLKSQAQAKIALQVKGHTRENTHAKPVSAAALKSFSAKGAAGAAGVSPAVGGKGKPEATPFSAGPVATPKAKGKKTPPKEEGTSAVIKPFEEKPAAKPEYTPKDEYMPKTESVPKEERAPKEPSTPRPEYDESRHAATPKPDERYDEPKRPVAPPKVYDERVPQSEREAKPETKEGKEGKEGKKGKPTPTPY